MGNEERGAHLHPSKARDDANLLKAVVGTQPHCDLSLPWYGALAVDQMADKWTANSVVTVHAEEQPCCSNPHWEGLRCNGEG